MNMNKNTLICAAAVMMPLSGCAQQWHVTGVEKQRIVVDKRLDARPDSMATAFIAPYKHAVDSMMSPLMGRAASHMNAYRPESPLSNLMADILMWAGKKFGEHPQMAVYNMGGIRAAISKGDITKGDVIDVAPFENHICFLTLRGDALLELFQQIAGVGGEAVSHGVRMVVDSDRKVKSVTLNGQPIDPGAGYRIATLDYVAQGNDNMAAFKKKTNVNQPTDMMSNSRFLIMEYMQEMTRQGKEIDARVEGRITIEK